MAVFDEQAFDDHERVVFCSDPASGLRAIIAIHSTALGPAAGGCRQWRYASDGEALHDVLRLSQGMSYKNAMAGLRFGGGKAVIIDHDNASEGDDLYVSVTLPNIIVGTVGGGTGLPSAAACLDILGLAGSGNAAAFAEVCGGIVLAGEISIIGAFCSGDFAAAHQSLSREGRFSRSQGHE